MKKLTAIVVGFGSRSNTYACYAESHPEELKIVAVADPIPQKLEKAKNKHDLPESALFSDWKDLANQPKIADFAIIGTQDNLHTAPALALIEKGYNLLLEKPIAQTTEECKQIVEAAENKGVKVVICHVLRFTKFWYALKEIIDRDEIGDIVSVSHFENVGNIHQSHSYVRGPWKNANEATPMILAKSCHDTDILQWLIGKECKKVQSFGSLAHFTKKNKPEDAPHRCMEGCPHADSCFYDAKKVYLDKSMWFRDNAFGEASDEEILELLKTSPLGVCVYDCDNNVVDHQVVNMEFEGGITASLSMNAFNEGGRFIKIFGTKGEITAYMGKNEIDVYSFATKQHKVYELLKVGEHINSGHGGGDEGIMIDTLKFFRGEETSKSICSVRMSYISHLIGFAAEKSRLTNQVIDLDEYSKTFNS